MTPTYVFEDPRYNTSRPQTAFLQRKRRRVCPPSQQPHGFYMAFCCRESQPSGCGTEIPTATCVSCAQRGRHTSASYLDARTHNHPSEEMIPRLLRVLLRDRSINAKLVRELAQFAEMADFSSANLGWYRRENRYFSGYQRTAC